MPIEFTCSNCSTVLRVADEHLGKQARCPHCEALNIVSPESTPQPIAKSAPDFNPYRGPSNTAVRTNYQLAHRGGMILALSIVSIVCNPFMIPGIMAWVMGRSDLKKIRSGVMDREGEGLTQAGMIIGMIMTILYGLGMLLYFGLIILMLFAAAAGGMN